MPILPQPTGINDNNEVNNTVWIIPCFKEFQKIIFADETLGSCNFVASIIFTRSDQEMCREAFSEKY